ncbi:MAG: S8 family serine peptidase [Bdellovibrionales bacterium]|nr:S8 family serine peptidase [Bdellovibrionales bacterium]
MKKKLLTLSLLVISSTSLGKANDSWITQALGLHRLPQALQKKKGPVIVAIIDTGADISYQDLKSRLWTNPGENGFDVSGHSKATNGIDDDGNGKIDDVHGWNFISDTPRFEDTHGHGTHVLGIIDQVLSTSHTQPSEVQFMILKYYDTKLDPARTLQLTVEAVEYAVRNGAHIINYSGGGLSPNPAERQAIKRAEAAGVLLVAAAGNDGMSTDIRGYYPASYPFSNILAVGGITSNLRRVPSSNFGLHSVSLSAPGDKIESLLPNGKKGEMTGTSQATAYATGIAAILLSQRKDLQKPKDLIHHLLTTAQTKKSLEEESLSGGIINLTRASAMRTHRELADDLPATNYNPATEELMFNLGQGYLDTEAQTQDKPLTLRGR